MRRSELRVDSVEQSRAHSPTSRLRDHRQGLDLCDAVTSHPGVVRAVVKGHERIPHVNALLHCDERECIGITEHLLVERPTDLPRPSGRLLSQLGDYGHVVTPQRLPQRREPVDLAETDALDRER